MFESQIGNQKYRSETCWGCNFLNDLTNNNMCISSNQLMVALVIANYSVDDLIFFLANFIQHFVSCLIDLIICMVSGPFVVAFSN